MWFDGYHKPPLSRLLLLLLLLLQLHTSKGFELFLNAEIGNKEQTLPKLIEVTVMNRTRILR